jgi:hypothetical protein
MMLDKHIENRLWRDIMLFKLREMKWRIIMGAVLITLRTQVESIAFCTSTYYPTEGIHFTIRKHWIVEDNIHSSFSEHLYLDDDYAEDLMENVSIGCLREFLKGKYDVDKIFFIGDIQ